MEKKRYVELRDRGGYPAGPLGYVCRDYMARTTAIDMADIPESEIPADAVRLDMDHGNPDAEYKVYGWMTDDGEIKLWTNADTIRLDDYTAEMFSNLPSVTRIDLSMFSTEGLTSTKDMFLNCKMLESVDLSGFDTTEVRDMSGMFCGCESLTSLDLTSFNTTSTWDMSRMFSGCSNLKSVNLSSFRNGMVSMDRMFDHCLRLESIDISCFHIGGIQDMTAMFCECMNLKEIRFPSATDRRLSPPMNKMFDGCESLESLDLSAFDGQSIREAENLLRNCNSLKDVRYPDDNLETIDIADIQF